MKRAPELLFCQWFRGSVLLQEAGGKMNSFTVNAIFNLLKERKAIKNPDRGGYRFTRRERVESVFPGQFCKEIALRSASYYSWFLNMDKQAAPVCNLLRKMFEEDVYGVVQEMVEKCGRLLGKAEKTKQVIDTEIWNELLELAGREYSLFVRGSEGLANMEQMVQAAPQRALAYLFLAAGMGGITPAQYEKLGSCWQLMNQVFLSEELEEEGVIAASSHRMQAGELLLLDGNRREALQQFEQAAEILRRDLVYSGQAVSGRASAGRTSDVRNTVRRSDSEQKAGDDAKRELLGKIFLRMGEIYLHDIEEAGSEDRTDGRAGMKAQSYLQESAALGCVSANDPLALLMIQNREYKEAKTALLRGAEAGLMSCLRMLGNAYYRGDEIAGGTQDIQQAVHYYMEGACPQDPASGDSVCQYMLGRILEDYPQALSERLTGIKSYPAYWYAAAARSGNEDAAACLNRLRWLSSGKEAGLEDWKTLNTVPSGNKICLINSRSERCLQLTKTLPEEQYSIFVCIDGFQERSKTCKDADPNNGGKIKVSDRTMAQTLYGIGMYYLEEAEKVSFLPDGSDPVEWLWEAFPEILCAAMDDEEQRNIQDGLSVLEAVYLLHEKSSIFAGKNPAAAAAEDDTSKKSQQDWMDRLFYLFSDRVKLYVLGNEDCAAPVFDSACSRLGDFYIPLYLCDPAKMASFWLLDRLPLFIPALQEHKKHKQHLSNSGSMRMDVAVFGDHPGIVQLCKDIIATAQIEDAERFPFSLTVVSECADLLEEKFAAECPGIMAPPKGTAVSEPIFIRLRPESRLFQKLMTGQAVQGLSEEEKRSAEKLHRSRYLIVYTKEERRNLSLAMYLREWYLKTDPSFRRLPFIAAYSENRIIAEQMKTLTAGSEKAGFSWYNNYGIEPFGTPKQLFSYNELVESRLEKCGLASHFSYYSFSAMGDRCRAEHDYFSRAYNRDSSIMNALSLSYRLFSAGITFSDWHDYEEGVSREELAQEFEKWLDEDSGPEADGNQRLETLAMYEHGRWNRFMLSRGWMPASMEQMLAYIQRGNFRHQLYIGRLHPFICSWEQLGQAGDFPTGIQKEYNSIMRQMRPDREPSDIRGIDRENVRKTAQILGADCK